MTRHDRPAGATDLGRPHVVAICGSRREGSYTRQALAAVLTAVEEHGGTTELIDLDCLDLPPLDPDRDDVPDGTDLARRLREADAIVLGTPTYHGSYSGVLKNALDYCTGDEFAGTTVGLLAVAGGPFPTTPLDHLRAVCRSLHAWVLPHEVAVPHTASAFDGDGFAEEAIAERVRTLGEQLVRYANVEPREVRSAGCAEAPSES